MLNRSTLQGLGLLGGILAGGVLLRAWGIGAAGLWHDEALSHFYALHDPGWILTHCAGSINHPPLFFLLLRGWLQLVPPFDQTGVESINLVIGLATLGVFALWCRRLFSPRGTILLTGFMTLHPLHVHFSTELRMYALGVLGVTAAGLFATRLLRSRFREPVSGVGWSLAALVSLYSHSFTGLYLLAITLVLTLEAARRGRLVWWAGWLGGVVVLYSPWFVFVLRQVQRISSDYWIGPFEAGQLVTLLEWWGGYVGPRSSLPTRLAKGALVAAGVLAPLCWSARRWREPVVRLLWALVLVPPGVVVLLSSWGGQSLFLYRTFQFAVPGVILLWGLGIQRLPRPFALVAVLLVGGLLGWELYGLKTNPPHPQLAPASRWVETEVASRRVILVHADRELFYSSLFYHRHRYPEVLLAPTPGPYRVTVGQLRDLARSRPLALIHRPPIDPALAFLRNSSHRVVSRRFAGHEYRLLLVP